MIIIIIIIIATDWCVNVEYGWEFCGTVLIEKVKTKNLFNDP